MKDFVEKQIKRTIVLNFSFSSLVRNWKPAARSVELPVLYQGELLWGARMCCGVFWRSGYTLVDYNWWLIFSRMNQHIKSQYDNLHCPFILSALCSTEAISWILRRFSKWWIFYFLTGRRKRRSAPSARHLCLQPFGNRCASLLLHGTVG